MEALLELVDYYAAQQCELAHELANIRQKAQHMRAPGYGMGRRNELRNQILSIEATVRMIRGVIGNEGNAS